MRLKGGGKKFEHFTKPEKQEKDAEAEKMAGFSAAVNSLLQKDTTNVLC